MSTCQVDHGVMAQFDGAARRSTNPEVGVLIGRLTDDREYVLLHIPTPFFEAGASAVAVHQGSGKKPAQKGKAAATPEVEVRIKVDWVVEHAQQVSTLLPGGVAVVGVYVCCPDAGFAAANSQLCRALTSIREQAGVGSSDLLILDISLATSKIALRKLPATAAQPNALKICEAKPAPVLASFVSITARHTLDAQLPVTDSSAALGQHFEELLAAEARAIEGCLACNCASGQLLQASAAVGDLCGPAGCSQLAVELLCPPTCVTASGAVVRSAELLGRARLHGAVQGRACVHKRDRWEAALKHLKADLVRSLKARLAALLAAEEEGAAAEDADGETGTGQLQQRGPGAHGRPLRALLPRRVLLPGQGPVAFSDYPLPGEEEAAQALATAEELLGLAGATEDQLEWPEEAAGASEPCGAWQPMAAAGQHVKGGLEEAKAGSCSPLMFGAAAAGVLAVALGVVYMSAMA